MSTEKIFIVMPAYNEEDNIREVVREWYKVINKLRANGVDAVLAIANDGSKDSTYKCMEELAQEHPYFQPIDKSNSGHGATVMFLYNYAVRAGADYIFQTDSDGQTLPDEFWQMWDARKNYDIQIGNRRNREDGFSRVVVTKVLKAVVTLTFGVSVPDANTPFRLFNARTMKPVIDLIPDDFFLSNVALSAISKKKEMKCRWIPITFRSRQGGVNSINLRRIFKIGWKSIGDLYKINNKIKYMTSK